MAPRPRVVIIDDDPLSSAMVQARIEDRFPDLPVTVQADPEPIEPYDVYLVDNDFEGRLIGPDVARRVRRRHPDALIIALSGTLTRETLKGFLNAGCDGACDKTEPAEFDQLLDRVGAFLDKRREQRVERARGLLGTLHAMTGLLREWNRRLERLERDG